MNLAVLDNKYVVAISAALVSIIGTLITQHVLNRRARFRYSVIHGRLGVSANDAIFGIIRVTWNGNAVANLYSSTIDLVNESMRDFENVVVRVFTNDTILLTQRTEIVGTTRILEWTPEYAEKLRVPDGQQPNQQQFDLYNRQREFLVPTMNRGQVVRLTFLNAAKTQEQPTLWLDVLHKGVKLEFGVAQNQILGVSQPMAALVGSIEGLIVVAGIVVFVPCVWLAASVAFVYGLSAQVPGAYTVRATRAIQHFFGG